MDRTTGTRATNTLGRVRKLLARAERAGTPEEAQACTDKAVELMARHGIDMALLSAAEPGLDEVGATRMEVADPYSAGKARLLGWTASALRCRLEELTVTIGRFEFNAERVNNFRITAAVHENGRRFQLDPAALVNHPSAGRTNPQPIQ